MNKDDQKETHPVYDDHDPMSLFLFGKIKNEKEQKKTEHFESEQARPLNEQEKTSLDEWLFGNKGKAHHKPDRNDHVTEELPLMDLINHIDVEKLAENIDSLMTTASQFKPLWEQVTPLIKKWIK